MMPKGRAILCDLYKSVKANTYIGAVRGCVEVGDCQPKNQRLYSNECKVHNGVLSY